MALQVRVLIMGFAVPHEREVEYSLCFPELIEELKYLTATNYQYAGSVNTGDDECVKRRVAPPIKTELAYRGDLIKLNQNYRKQLTKKIRSNINQNTWPTTVFISDFNNRLLGMIVLPDRNWLSNREDFFKNLRFFLNPFLDGYRADQIVNKNGLKSPCDQIILLDAGPLNRAYNYEISQTL